MAMDGMAVSSQHEYWRFLLVAGGNTSASDKGHQKGRCSVCGAAARDVEDAAVEKEHSSEASQHTSAATSSIWPKRPIGIFDSMKSMCAWVIWSKMAVRTAAGVTQFTVILFFASSLPSDLVRPITPALEAL